MRIRNESTTRDDSRNWHACRFCGEQFRSTARRPGKPAPSVCPALICRQALGRENAQKRKEKTP